MAGNAVAAPSGGNGINPGSTALAGASAAGDAATAAYFAYADVGAAETLDVPVLALALAATSIYETVEFFLDVLSGSHPPTPRQLLHARHPLYDLIVGILKSLTPDESSAAEGSADPFTVSGVASFYYPDPTGKTGCKGYSYTDAEGFTAAMHKEIVGPNGKFPCGTTANVTYSPPGGVPRTIAVRVIDHGPYDKEGRVIDLSPGAFKALAGSLKPGTIPVTVTFPEGPKAPLQAGD